MQTHEYHHLHIVIVALAAVLLVACRTTKETSFVEQHRVETLIDRMDSLVRVKSVSSQDSSWRETILRQFQSIRERSDTSRYVVADTAGNIIRERIVINNVRETSSETDRQEFQYLSHRIETMDSTLSVMRRQLQHSDSLLQQKETTVVRQSVSPLSWWQKARIWFSNLVLVALALLAAVWALKKKSPWFFNRKSDPQNRKKIL